MRIKTPRKMGILAAGIAVGVGALLAQDKTVPSSYFLVSVHEAFANPYGSYVGCQRRHQQTLKNAARSALRSERPSRARSHHVAQQGPSAGRARQTFSGNHFG
jgi:hypothetical protein